MGKSSSLETGSRLSSAKLRRHQRVQKMISRRNSPIAVSRTGGPLTLSPDCSTTSSSTSSPSDDEMTKQQRRKLRNRLSAAANREKKREKVAFLEGKISALERENCYLYSLLLQRGGIRAESSLRPHPTICQSAVPIDTITRASAVVADECRFNEYAIQI